MAAVAPSRSGVSPSSSPRLPSPPPIPEVQFGPKSPGISDLSNELSLDAASKPDEGAARRIRPGTTAADMAMAPPLVPLSQLDSPFQLQEHLKALYATLTHTEGFTHTVPVTKDTALRLTAPPQINDTETVDRNLWLYELCRFLTQKANIVSVFLMNDNPACSGQTCPEMRASEWQYLCAVHEPPKSCCAIDYCNHTLDWAANVLTSPKHFPSRLALGGESGNAIQSMRQLTNIFRRVYRIFAHAWFQHREIFWSVEGTYGLYLLFKTVCDEYHLIPEDSYTIPAEAEGSQEESDDTANNTMLQMQILRKDNPPSYSETVVSELLDNSSNIPNSAATARRHKHKHTPSTGSLVDTITEGHEDEEESSSSTDPALGHTGEPPSSDESTTESQPQPTDQKDPPSERALPKLDIGATVPKYDLRAPEDPTPIATSHETDPMSLQSSKTVQPMDTDTNEEVTNEQEMPSQQLDGQDEQIQIQKRADSDDEEEIRSPSGGSVRTGGSDVLKAILGHMTDSDDEDDMDERTAKSMSDNRASPVRKEAAKAEQSDKSDVEGKENQNTEDSQTAVREEATSEPDKAEEGDQ